VLLLIWRDMHSIWTVLVWAMWIGWTSRLG
jgi:hypothetical protein